VSCGKREREREIQFNGNNKYDVYECAREKLKNPSREIKATETKHKLNAIERLSV
jgi:hypothetical protein